MGAGTLIWQNTKLKTSEGRQTQLKCEVQMRTEEEKMKTKKKKREKKAFYFLFCQNEFQGSSAPGDVVVRCQKASYKYRLSSERTTSQHRPLCGHKQRKWMVMQTKEEKTRAEEKRLKGGCKLVSVRRSSLVKKPTQTWRKWNEGEISNIATAHEGNINIICRQILYKAHMTFTIRKNAKTDADSHLSIRNMDLADLPSAFRNPEWKQSPVWEQVPSFLISIVQALPQDTVCILASDYASNYPLIFRIIVIYYSSGLIFTI